MSYPTALDTSGTLPTPSASNNTNNPSHAGLHGLENVAIIALETKLGIGSSVPAASTLLIGTGAGTSAWSALTSAQLAAVLSDETGSGAAVFANTPVLITPKIDSIQENTVGNGTTINGVLLKSSKMNGSYLTDGTVGSLALATGVPVQTVGTTFSAVATGTTVLPADNSIPQNTEGDQYMTQAITPKSTTNRLSIEVSIMLATSAGVSDVSAAIFQDSTAGALGGILTTSPAANYMLNLKPTHDMVAGTTSSTTFKIRAGAGNAGTTTFNGQSGVGRFGGITISSIKITEYKV